MFQLLLFYFILLLLRLTLQLFRPTILYLHFDFDIFNSFQEIFNIRRRHWTYNKFSLSGNHYIGTLHSGRRCPARPDGDIRPEAILSTSFGTLRTAIHRQVTCTCQIWIPGWILPHFDVRTISVASKLKKLQIFLYY